jgi:hypothetical protein
MENSPFTAVLQAGPVVFHMSRTIGKLARRDSASIFGEDCTCSGAAKTSAAASKRPLSWPLLGIS